MKNLNYTQWRAMAREYLKKAAQAERERDLLAANFHRSGAAHALVMAAKNCRTL
jgi:hypothetical protein